MSSKTALWLNLGISFIFALAIIFFDDAFSNWIIALWLIPFTLLSFIGIRDKE